MTGNPQDQFKTTLAKAYNKLLSNHSRKAEFLTKMNNVLGQRQKEYEFITNASYRISNTSVTPSYKSKSDISVLEFDDKYFNCDFIFKSPELTKVLLFIIIAGLIINQNLFRFQVLENNINDYLSENSTINAIIMGSITRFWQKIKELFIQNKSIKWQKSLKDLVDKFPTQFTTIACNEFIGAPILSQHKMDSNLIIKIVKEISANISIYVINFKQIERAQKYGNFNVDMYFGYFKQQKIYVISNRLPEISAEQIRLKKLAGLIHKNINQMLNQYYNDNQQIVVPEMLNASDPNHNSKIKQFLSKKVNQLGLQ